MSGHRTVATSVLLDTNAYLRLAKRVRPLLGVPFGQKNYMLTILPDVEDEVLANGRLRFRFPWFETDGELANERLAKTIRLSPDEREQMGSAAQFLHDWVLQDVRKYMVRGGSPPGPADCRALAFGQIRPAIVTTDDLGMHLLANEFGLAVWHGFELLAKLRTAKKVSDAQVREIYEMLEANEDLPASWRHARHNQLAKVFGPARPH